MDKKARQYLCIDLKSFYASVECVERGLDPMTTRLVVADPERSEKTICLAVSPAMKAAGVSNRCRVFEIPKNLSYIMAPPRMQLYIERSADVYSVYLNYVSPDDIHVYSIDEVFMDVTPYLDFYGCTARELGERIRADVSATTGIPATCGIGTNLFLAKVALDISAKKSPDFFGELDEQSYRETLWDHVPLSDFWRIGDRIEARLNRMGIHTMGELALAPEEALYQEFGIDAEIMIDHAWGIEPVRIEHIKAYKGKSHSLSNAQVLPRDYSFDEAFTIIKEMCDTICLELSQNRQVASTVHLYVGYAMTDKQRKEAKRLGTTSAWIGAATRSGGTRSFPAPSCSRAEIMAACIELFEEHTSRSQPIRRMGITLGGVHDKVDSGTQLGLIEERPERKGEDARQDAINAVKKRFGKNALLKGIDLLDHATQRDRNVQIGGHKSGE